MLPPSLSVRFLAFVGVQFPRFSSRIVSPLCTQLDTFSHYLLLFFLLMHTCSEPLSAVSAMRECAVSAVFFPKQCVAPKLLF